jgi:glycerol kinase
MPPPGRRARPDELPEEDRMRYVLAIDQGTTSTTVVVLDEQLAVTAKASHEFPQIYPQPSWVEHDGEAIYATVCHALADALDQAGIAGGDIAGIGITNQRETTLLWSRRDGRPIANAIVWQDRRTAPLCEALRAAGHEDMVRARTGLVLDPYFAGTKIRWLLDHVDGARARATAGELCFGTIDSWLVYRLSGGGAHVTDVTNASRTLLLDLAALTWDEEMCALLEVPPALLPAVRSSSEVYAHTRGVPGLPDGIPIAGMAGDQQAALFGQVCYEPGASKCTYGTGAFLLMNTGTRPTPSRHGLVSTVAWRLGAAPTVYALEGSAFIAGALVQWLRDGLGIIASAAEIEALARSVPDSGGVVVVPALAGLGAPHWRPEARGLVTGLTRGTTAAHLARAALEGIALQNHDLLRAMEKDSGQRLAALKVDGGAAVNDLLMQFQADILGVSISRPAMVETTALGAAFLAGLATGVWQSPAEISRAWREERRFEPTMPQPAVEEHLARWRAAIAKA